MIYFGGCTVANAVALWQARWEHEVLQRDLDGLVDFRVSGALGELDRQQIIPSEACRDGGAGHPCGRS
jgi:hypothetical protein